MRLLLLAAVSLAAFVPVASAEAQFDRLKKKMGDAVAERAGLKTPDGVREDDKLEFDDRVLELTSARLDAVVRGLAAEESAVARYKQESATIKERAKANKAQHEAEKRAYEQARRDYEAKEKAYTDCQLKAVGKVMSSALGALGNPAIRKLNERVMALPPAEQQALSARMEKIGEQTEAAEARKDAAAVAALRKQAVGEMARATKLSEAEVEEAMKAGQGVSKRTAVDAESATKACGPQPVEPPEPKDASDPEATLGSMDDYVEKAVQKASGMDGSQFGVARERVFAYLRNANRYAFRKSELETLAARKDELKKFEKQLEAR
jgi:hypothetical protein